MHFGQYDRAIEKLTEAVRLDGSQIEAKHDLGHCYLSQRNWGDAVDFFSKVLLDDGNHFGALLGRGTARLAQDRILPATRDFTRAIAVNAHDVEVWTGLANCFMKKNKWQSAINAYGQAIRLASQHAQPNFRAYLARARCHMMIGEWQQATDDLTLALQLEPNSVEVLNRRAQCYDHLGRARSAQADRARIQSLGGDPST